MNNILKSALIVTSKFNAKGLAFIIFLGIFATLSVGCQSDMKGADERLTVAVSIVPQETFVRAIAGELVDVVVLVPPGSSPTNYEPTPMELERFSKSAVYFAIGVPTEVSNLLPRAMSMEDLRIIKLNEDVAKVYPDREFAPGSRDPHIWLSPKRAMVMVERIKEELMALDPENASVFEANASAYVETLKALDDSIKSTVEGLENRAFIVFHPSFGYLADDYGLEMHALEQDGKEATVSRLKEMVDFAKANGLKAIFYQAEISSKQATAFAEEIGGKTVQLEPLAADYVANLRNMLNTMIEVMQ